MDRQNREVLSRHVFSTSDDAQESINVVVSTAKSSPKKFEWDIFLSKSSKYIEIGNRTEKIPPYIFVMHMMEMLNLPGYEEGVNKLEAYVKKHENDEWILHDNYSVTTAIKDKKNLLL